VLNQGQRNANRVEVQVLEVSNGISVPVGSVQTIGSIASGGSGSVQVPYDTTGKEGDHTILVVVDPANLIAELNEADNQAETTLTVSPPSNNPTVEPNLVMTSSSVIFTPTSPLPGQVVTLTINVHNDGASDATGVVVRVMDVTESPVQVGDDVTIPTVAAGQTMSVTLSYDTTDKTGSRSLTVSADPDNKITESNENDNTTTVTIPLASSTALSSSMTGGRGTTIPVVDPNQEPQTSELKIEMAEDLDKRN
jgi:subtilase family serine protease